MPLDGMDEIKTLAVELKTASDGVKKIAETTQAELKNLGVITAETKETSDKLLAKQGELNARLTELEQASASANRGGGSQALKSMGAQFVEADHVKHFLQHKTRGSVKLDVKAITSLSTDADGSAGALIRPDRRPGLLMIPDQRLFLRDLVAPGETTSNAIEYLQETGFVNNAASVPEMALKPESTLKFNMVTTTVTTIAHHMRASRQVLDDAAQLRSIIDQRLRYGVRLEEERQLLRGTGTNGDLTGIMTVATAYAAPFTLPGATSVDILRMALLQAELAEFPASGIAVHPMLWAEIELSKTSEGGYLFSNPVAETTPRLWGRPVVTTPALGAREWVVGAWRMGAQIFDRMDATVEVSTEDRDNFVRNAVTILGEERVGFAIYRPEAFTFGTMPALPA